MSEDTISSIVVHYQEVEDAPRENNGRTRRISKILLGCYKACRCCRLSRRIPRTPTTANTTNNNTDKRPMAHGDEAPPSTKALHSTPIARATPKPNVDDYCSPKKDQITQHRPQDGVLASKRRSQSPQQQHYTKRQVHPRHFVFSPFVRLGEGGGESSPARSPQDSPLYTMPRLQTTMVVTPSARSSSTITPLSHGLSSVSERNDPSRDDSSSASLSSHYCFEYDECLLGSSADNDDDDDDDDESETIKASPRVLQYPTKLRDDAPRKFHSKSTTSPQKSSSRPLPQQHDKSFRSTMNILMESSTARRDSLSAVCSDDVPLWYHKQVQTNSTSSMQVPAQLTIQLEQSHHSNGRPPSTVCHPVDDESSISPVSEDSFFLDHGNTCNVEIDRGTTQEEERHWISLSDSTTSLPFVPPSSPHHDDCQSPASSDHDNHSCGSKKSCQSHISISKSLVRGRRVFWSNNNVPSSQLEKHMDIPFRFPKARWIGTRMSVPFLLLLLLLSCYRLQIADIFMQPWRQRRIVSSLLKADDGVLSTSRNITNNDNNHNTIMTVGLAVQKGPSDLVRIQWQPFPLDKILAQVRGFHWWPRLSRRRTLSQHAKLVIQTQWWWLTPSTQWERDQRQRRLVSLQRRLSATSTATQFKK